MTSGNRVSFTVNQRMDVLKDLETFSIRDVAKKYKVHRSTIWRIQQNATKIIDFANRRKLEKQRKSTRKPLYEELEQRLYDWFIEMRTIGTALSDALLIQKANELKEEVGACSDCQVSRGWISRFKKRYQIRLVNIYGEKASADEDGANSFVHNLKKYIEERDEERAADERNEERPVNEGNEERPVDESNEERPVDEGNEETAVDEGNEERPADEGNKEHGIELPRDVKKKLEDAFQCFESYKNYFPRSVLCHLDGIKLTIFGDTTSNNDPPSSNDTLSNKDTTVIEKKKI